MSYYSRLGCVWYDTKIHTQTRTNVGSSENDKQNRKKIKSGFFPADKYNRWTSSTQTDIYKYKYMYMHMYIEIDI